MWAGPCRRTIYHINEHRHIGIPCQSVNTLCIVMKSVYCSKISSVRRIISVSVYFTGKDMTTKSPLAPKKLPKAPSVGGVNIASGICGLRYINRRDVMLAVFDMGTTVAGTFTKSRTAAAPVNWCKKSLKSGSARALVVNSGNANAFTGRRGDLAVRKTACVVAELIGCNLDEVFVSSTGVIGEPLPVERLTSFLPSLARKLKPTGWANSARAIMTTDTFPKVSVAKAKIGSKQVTLCGISKGSGMIAPDMATMLSFIFTDAKIESRVLQTCLKSAVDKSFNAITVDGDTSTSDTVLLFATGMIKNFSCKSATDPKLRDFRKALDALTLDLAHQVVKDGEGASKFISVTVTGADTKTAAKAIALSIANSPLVKTAIAGADANWGRIVMAVGKAGERANRDKMTIMIGGIKVAENGFAVSEYDEKSVNNHLKGTEVNISVDVGIGYSKKTVWTCDLTHDYIRINSDYRS